LTKAFFADNQWHLQKNHFFGYNASWQGGGLLSKSLKRENFNFSEFIKSRKIH